MATKTKRIDEQPRKSFSALARTNISLPYLDFRHVFDLFLNISREKDVLGLRVLNPRFDTQLSLTYNTLPVVRDLLIVFIIFQNNSDILKVVVGDVVSTNLSSLDFYDDLVSTIAFSLLCGYLLEMVYYVIEAVYTIFFQ